MTPPLHRTELDLMLETLTREGHAYSVVPVWNGFYVTWPNAVNHSRLAHPTLKAQGMVYMTTGRLTYIVWEGIPFPLVPSL